MDFDDPERRIADLERQLAERRAAAGDPGAAAAGWLTPEQVRGIAFSKPPIGKRGYHEGEVDAFLDHVEAALRDPSGSTLTAEQVRNVAFSRPPIGRRGYNVDQVDEFLDIVERQVKSRQAGFAASPQAGVAPSTAGPLAARHGSTRHAAGESRLERAWNVVVRCFAWILDY